MRRDSDHPASAELEQDTVVAISTPPGRGGIGIVRLSGPQAREIASAWLQLQHPLEHARARFAHILHDGAPLDDAVVTFFAAPNSYTGENLVEIAAHGSPVVLDLLVRKALAAGARLARPGEFTERAFLSGRVDLAQAEAVRDLIEAQTLFQARIAAEQMGGALARRIQPAKDDLLSLIALLEAGIDFAEDDIEVVPEAIVTGRIRSIESALAPIAASYAQGRILRAGITLAIVGRPNAGKSSLFNRLVERDRAIVTAAPGTTRDLVTELITIGGIPVELVDTAGLRESADEAESLGIAKTHTAIAEADAVLLVFDASLALAQDALQLSDEESTLLASLAGRPVLAALNKIDLVASSVRAMLNTTTLQGLLPAAGLVITSAATGEGIAKLRERLLEITQLKGAESAGGMITNLRQYEALQRCGEALNRALAAAQIQTPHEMLLLDLYETLRSLDDLTGQTTSDDVLHRIFASFCIGK